MEYLLGNCQMTMVFGSTEWHPMASPGQDWSGWGHQGMTPQATVVRHLFRQWQQHQRVNHQKLYVPTVTIAIRLDNSAQPETI